VNLHISDSSSRFLNTSSLAFQAQSLNLILADYSLWHPDQVTIGRMLTLRIANTKVLFLFPIHRVPDSLSDFSQGQEIQDAPLSSPYRSPQSDRAIQPSGYIPSEELAHQRFKDCKHSHQAKFHDFFLHLPSVRFKSSCFQLIRV